MAELGYEIKYGKHIAFKPKDKSRFTRAKTIGEDYTEKRIKNVLQKKHLSKRIGNVIDMNTNMKVKESKGYEYWATKNNLNTMAESVIFLREQGIKSVNQLDEYIQKAVDERQNLQDKIKVIDIEIQKLSATMDQVHAVTKYRKYYKEYKAIRLTRHFLKSTRLTLPYMKMLSQSLKNLIPSSQIQRIF